MALFLQLSQKSVAFMGWLLSITCSSRISVHYGSLTECMKKGTFEWKKAAQRAFESIKGRLCSALILALPNLELLFEVECDASRVRVSAVLTQAKHPLAYFSEKLNGSRLNYSTYD